MIRKYLLPLFAVAGVVIGIIAAIVANRPAPVTRSEIQLPNVPFASYVAGTGLTEASGGNIAVGTPVPGIVTAIYVKWGDRVRAGDRLFKIDDGDLQAQLLPAGAREKESEARLEQAVAQLRIAEGVSDKRAISVEELNNRRAAVAIGEAALAVARAQTGYIRLEIGRRTVRALAPGQILHVRVRPGEFAPNGALATPLMVLGNDARLYLRVDIDEYEAWRIRPGAPATAFMRGNPDLHASLRFERIEPYVIPKVSLTGGSTERVDTRVLQVIYSVDPALLPNTYVGQQMDVFIQAPPLASALSAGSGAGRSTVDSP